MKISLDRLFQQKFALLRVISDLSCQYMQYILQLKFKDICLSQTQMKTQSNQITDEDVQILESQVNNDDRSPGDDTDQTSNSETEKLFSVVPFST